MTNTNPTPAEMAVTIVDEIAKFAALRSEYAHSCDCDIEWWMAADYHEGTPLGDLLKRLGEQCCNVMGSLDDSIIEAAGFDPEELDFTDPAVVQFAIEHLPE